MCATLKSHCWKLTEWKRGRCTKGGRRRKEAGRRMKKDNENKSNGDIIWRQHTKTMKAHGTEPQHFVRQNNKKPFKPFFGNESQNKKGKNKKKGSNKNNGTIVSRECHRSDKLISVPCLISYSPLSTSSDFSNILSL